MVFYGSPSGLRHSPESRNETRIAALNTYIASQEGPNLCNEYEKEKSIKIRNKTAIIGR